MITVATSSLRAVGATEAVIARALEHEKAERQAARREQWRIAKRKQRARQQCPAGQHKKANENNDHVNNVQPDQKKCPRTPIRKLHLRKSKKISFGVGRAQKSEIPIDWKPDRDHARACGLAEPEIERQAERFRLHAQANGRRQADWAASWRLWLTSPYLRPAQAAPVAKSHYDPALDPDIPPELAAHWAKHRREGRHVAA